MKRRTAGRRASPRICAFCNHPLVESRPVFLVTLADNRIVGPLHAGCAERCVIAAKEIRERGLEPAIDYGRVIHAAREETLPW